jgi:hypothetical protein
MLFAVYQGTSDLQQNNTNTVTGTITGTITYMTDGSA